MGQLKWYSKFTQRYLINFNTFRSRENCYIVIWKQDMSWENMTVGHPRLRHLGRHKQNPSPKHWNTVSLQTDHDKCVFVCITRRWFCTCFGFRVSRSRACRARTGRDLRVVAAAVVCVWVFLHFEAELRGESFGAL